MRFSPWIFSHRYRRNSISSSLTIEYPYQKTIELSANLEKFQGTATLKTPFHDDITATAGMYGTSVQANLQYAAGKNINMQAALQKQGITASFTSPCPWLRSVSFSTESLGPGIAKTTLDYHRFNGPIEGTIAFSREDADFDTSFLLKTPFEMVQDFHVRLSHKNVSWKKYASTVSAIYNKQQVVDLQTSVKFAHIGNFNGDLQLTTMFREAEAVSMSFRHKGQPTRFSNNAEFSLNGDKHTYSGEFRSDGAVTGEFKVNEKSLSFNQEGSLRNLRTSAQVTYALEKRISTAVTLVAEGDIDAKVEFSAPFCKDVLATISHTGPLDNFRHISQVKYGRHSGTATASFKLSPNGLISQLKVETPFTEDIEVLVTHDGIPKAFQTTGSVRFWTEDD